MSYYKYFYFILFCLLSNFLLKTNAFKFDIRSMKIYNFSIPAIDDILYQMQSFTLHYKNLEDIENNFVQYLLKQSFCLKDIHQKNKKFNKEIYNAEYRFHAIVSDKFQLRRYISIYAKRNTIIFAVILDELNLHHLYGYANELWHTQGIYKIMYIMPKQSYIYHPFKPTKDGGFGELVDAASIQWENIGTNFNGYPLRVLMFKSAYTYVNIDEVETKQIEAFWGVDVLVAKTLSEEMNFTLKMAMPDRDNFGERLPNGSFSGALGRVLRNEVDVVLTGYFVKDYLTDNIDFSVSVYMDQLCIYCQKSGKIPQSIALLYAVNVDIWLGFWLIGLLCSVMWMLLRRLNLCNGRRNLSHKFKTKWQWVRIFNDSWVTWVSRPIVKLPPFSSECTYWISMSLVSVIMRSVLESSISTAFIEPLEFKDVQTMKELDATGWNIYTRYTSMLVDCFNGLDTPVYRSLNSKLFLSKEPIFEQVVAGIKQAGVGRASQFELENFPFVLQKKVYLIPECVKNYHIGYIFIKHSEFKPSINLKLLHFLTAGLIQKWIRDFEFINKVKFTKSVYSEEMDYMKFDTQLNLKDVQISFYVIMIGSLIATLVLFFEIYAFKYLKKDYKTTQRPFKKKHHKKY